MDARTNNPVRYDDWDHFELSCQRSRPASSSASDRLRYIADIASAFAQYDDRAEFEFNLHSIDFRTVSGPGWIGTRYFANPPANDCANSPADDGPNSSADAEFRPIIRSDDGGRRSAIASNRYEFADFAANSTDQSTSTITRRRKFNDDQPRDPSTAPIDP